MVEKKKNWFKRHKIWSGIIGFLVLMFIMGIFVGDDSSNNKTDDVTNQNQPSSNCAPDWECSDWSECSSLGTQTRTCTDINNCEVLNGKPKESQSCEIRIVEPEPILISGSGKKATEIFRLESGLSVFDLENSGTSNFIIWLLDSNGNRIELLANEIGSFKGSTALGVDAGDYLLDIDGQSWKINIKQPRPTSAQSIPKTFTGNSRTVTDFFKVDGGLTRFELKYDGDGNFIIWLLDKDGNKIELLVNEISSFDGSKAIGLNKGIYLLDVTGEGNWQIDVN